MQHQLNEMKRIGFCGLGHMGGAIAHGILAQTSIQAHQILVFDRAIFEGHRTSQFKCLSSNLAVAQQVDVLMIAVKPQMVTKVCHEISQALTDNPKLLIVSIAAGVSLQTLQKALSIKSNAPARIVRVMPNTPALVGQGMTTCFANSEVTQSELSCVMDCFRPLGLVEVLAQEEDLHAATALAGSLPGFVFQALEALEAAGLAHGLSPSLTQTMVRQAVMGAGALASHEKNKSATELKQQVTSPGGTTQAGLDQLKQHDFGEALTAAVQAAIERSKALQIENQI